ncbi:WD40 repeat-like protein [Guyanagaster necrorhizus]|uniref:WD40 repeat-like protein n=1 Tax=Guyanagaster necrorhizus TaxID=856835 RepID=A0A9P7VLT7_9AGAR|nr:WD40 repeat-like protein [Guyanagaster necrorhizus MCA 3950]KAG7443551.1 WD40 repeat-like protein [Guyanagaster necrorhizus MCA 3950]
MDSPVYPYSQLIYSSSSAFIAVSGPHIQIIDPSTGKVLSSSTNFAPDEQKTLLSSGPIRCAALNSGKIHLATVGDDKTLRVWNVGNGDLKVASERELPKKPTCVAFTANGQTILVSDKFGDIFSYPLDPPFVSKVENPKRDRTSLISHPSASNGTLILGHTSLLTTFLLSSDEKYIITADRDEHIRVSWHPQGYCIETFCLGSTKFVSALHVPKYDPSVLISGGGDAELKVWDWLSGQWKCDIPIWNSVKDYIMVKTKPYQKGRKPDDDDDKRQSPELNKRRKKSGRSRAGDKEAEVVDMDVDASQVNGEAQILEEEAPTVAEEATVLVVQKIDSIAWGDKTYVLFGIVGGTAVFVTQFPTDGLAHEIHAYNVDKPVLDFILASEEGTAAPIVWISVDSACSGSDTPITFVSLAQITMGGGLSAVPEDALPVPQKQILSTLNSSLISASMKEFDRLDLYGALKSMPKNTGVEYNPMHRPDLDEASASGNQARGKKELGKLKSKRAVMEKQRQGEGEDLKTPENL